MYRSFCRRLDFAWPRYVLLIAGILVFGLLGLSSFVLVRAEPIDLTVIESTALPTPAWVQMVDQGSLDPRLAGFRTPAGVKVEIVAEEPAVVNPVAMTFDDNGVPYVLEWRVAAESRQVAEQVTLQDGSVMTVNRRRKAVGDVLKTLADADGDGRYDQAKVLLDDLETPSTLLMHDGWLYTASLGSVTRRKLNPADGKFGQPEEIVRGLSGFGRQQASGLTMSHDGWLFISSGEGDNHGEGVDGSRATVLRTGAILRCRPDGSHLQEFARGFCNPHGNAAFDQHFNLFHLDDDRPDDEQNHIANAAPFDGVRLIHAQDGADYGWRLQPGAVCCQADTARTMNIGESQGKLPSMLKTGRGSPAGLLIYNGTRFPAAFRGLLIYPDAERQSVLANNVERAGSTFAVTQQFTLLSSDDPLFRPCQAVQGPDGAIYIVDCRSEGMEAGELWGDGEHGRIYKLSWSGTPQWPAISLDPMDMWANTREYEDETLWSLLDTPDVELRKRVQRGLLGRRGNKSRARFLEVAASQGRSSPARVTALGAVCQIYNREVYEALIRLLKDGNIEVRRTAAELLGRNAPTNSHEAIAALYEAMKDPHPAVAASAALSYGQLVNILPLNDDRKLKLTEQMRNALAACDRDDPFLYDAMLRGMERMGTFGIQKLLLWAWSNDDEKCETAVRIFEALRTVEAAEGLNRMLQGDTAFNDDQHARLMRCYLNIQVEPPISAQRIAEWLAEHDDAAVEIKVAGIETLAVMGGGDADTAQALALTLLKHEQADQRRGAIKAIGNARIVAAAPALLAALQEPNRDADERREIVATLVKLRGRPAPLYGVASPPGVEPLLGELLKLAGDAKQGEVRGEILALVGVVDDQKAEPIARKWLASKDALLMAAAIDVLGTRPERAEEMGQALIAGKIDRSLLPRVAAALERHAEEELDEGGPMHTLLAEVLKLDKSPM